MKRFWQGMANRLGFGRRPEQPAAAPSSRPPRPRPPHPEPPHPRGPRPPAAPTRPQPTAKPPAPGPPKAHAPSRGHRAGRRRLAYAPHLDGHADPGEVVWTWVKYEDDPHQGKDRPVLVVGREGSVLLGLMLSSQSERDGQHNWLSLGAGAWDREDRPSWVRLDRVLEVAEDGIRREGAVLDRTRFNAVARALRKGYGWA